MALMKTTNLKKYQLLDAYRTAPSEMGAVKLLARLLGTFGDSLYGKETFDAVVVGDDPLVSLGIALSLSRAGKTVLLAPDSIGRTDWPNKDWGYSFASTANNYDEEVGSVLSAHLEGFEGHEGYMRALSLLITECASSDRVTVLHHDYLQSSRGIIKGGTDLIFFPLDAEYEHCPLTNPLWRMVREKVAAFEFQHQEIEYVMAGKLYLSTPSSRFIDPHLGTRVGLARETDADNNRYSRSDNVLSAFSLNLRAQ
ncbi:hypothetical protein ACI77O_13310 [Pseudomonas tritici]|uniref:hypothetical protein n=1 Tax=Pseudomonas tritici TaxID=2745518 RepID=UPI00387B27F5